MRRILLVVACVTLLSPPAMAQPPAVPGITALLGRLEQTLRSGDRDGYTKLLAQSADRKRATEFAFQFISPRATRAVVRERDRTELAGTLSGDGYQLLVEVLIEYGSRARLFTWRLDVRRMPGVEAGSADEWGILDQESLTSLHGLYRLSLTPTKQYAAQDLVVTAEDLKLTLDSGSVFVAETDTGVTALVLLGRGEMTFSPTPAIERSQVKIFAGSENLASPFEVALVRLPPGEVDAHMNRGALAERPVDPKELRRAEEVFRQEIAKSFGLDLGELSAENWSLLPNAGDFLAEVRTRRFDTITYTRSRADVEDISVFDRKARKNIALYSSKSHQARYGRFFSEDQQSEFTVSHYDLDVSFNPARRLLDGRARLALEIKAKTGTNTLTVRIADSLNVRSVVSNQFGRLLFVRVRNQNAIVVNLPSTLTPGVNLSLNIEYGGPLAPQEIDREAIWPQQPQIVDDAPDVPIEETYLYSNRSYWYPQAPTTGYSTANIRLTVPAHFGCVASGDLASVTPVPGEGRSSPAARRFAFSATQPLRYLSFLVTALHDVRTDRVRLSSSVEAVRQARLSGVFYDDVEVVTKANPRMRGRARDLSKTGQDIIRFYTSLVGDCPYPTLTLAVIERQTPGGHSPAYLSVIAQASPGSRLTFRDDPASFPEFPEFFIAHEIAHQWWGQAVGWKNYHEQWLSEGFAQYFAALYAEKLRGRPVFTSMMRRMRNWARDESDQGPIYLGYRIGHVKSDTRLFRAVIYNKGAVVLHMLRQMLGDKNFFAGIRRFYEQWRFDKAGSDDLRRSLEAESGVSLARFFEQWVYGQDLPQVAVKWRVEPDGANQQAVVRLEQSGDTFNVPVTLTLDYLNSPPVDVVVRLNEGSLEARIPLTNGSTLRRIDINRDETLAVVR